MDKIGKPNPFKLFGSYVGAVAGLVIAHFVGWVFIAILGLCEGEFCRNSNLSVFILVYAVFVLSGFIIGASTHSLIKKKN